MIDMPDTLEEALKLAKKTFEETLEVRHCEFCGTPTKRHITYVLRDHEGLSRSPLWEIWIAPDKRLCMVYQNLSDARESLRLPHWSEM